MDTFVFLLFTPFAPFTFRQGHPILREVHDDCQYHFEWPTNVICPEHTVDYRADGCQLYSNDTRVLFDLKLIGDSGKIAVSTGGQLHFKNGLHEILSVVLSINRIRYKSKIRSASKICR